jgi:hypothetical protein
MDTERPKSAKAPTVGALGEAQSAGKTHCTRCARGADPSMTFSRTAPKVGALATRNWSIWGAPFGPATKQPFALLCSLELATASPVVARLATDCFLTGCIHQTLVVRPLACLLNLNSRTFCWNNRPRIVSVRNLVLYFPVNHDAKTSHRPT